MIAWALVTVLFQGTPVPEDPMDPRYQITADGSTSSPQAPSFGKMGARGRLWRADVVGTLRADEDGFPSTRVDVESALGIDDSERMNDLSLWFNSASGRLFGNYWWGSFDGGGALPSAMTFGGSSFGAWEEVVTKLEWEVWTAMYEYDIGIPGLEGMGWLRVGAGTKYLKLHGQVRSASNGAAVTLRAPMPVLGASAEVFLTNSLSAEVEASGLRVGDWFGGVNGTVYDVAAAARLTVFKGAFAGLGYRWFGLQAEDNSTNVDQAGADLQVTGFFAEAGIRF